MNRRLSGALCQVREREDDAGPPHMLLRTVANTDDGGQTRAWLPWRRGCWQSEPCCHYSACLQFLSTNMLFKTVYYSHFWYSRFASVSLGVFNGDFFNTELKNHHTYMRLLSLLFEHIYIPRTHLLTQIFDSQWEVPSALFESKEFLFMRDRGIVRIST